MKLNSIKIGTNNANKLYLGSNIINKIPIEFEQSTTIKSPEYVERTASANGYIGLGEYFTSDTVIEIDFQMTQAKGNAIVGDYGSNDNDDWRFFLNYDVQVNNKLNYDFINSRIYYDTGDWSKRFHIEIGNYYIKDLVSGNYWANSTSKSGFSRPNQMYLFHMDGAQITNNIDYGKVYSLKIKKNNVLVKDFIPWTDMNGNYGLYDKVSNTVFQSTGQMTGSSTIHDVVVDSGITTDYWEYVDMGTPTPPTPSRLPSGYTEAEYITSETDSSSQTGGCINTGVLLYSANNNSYEIAGKVTPIFTNGWGDNQTFINIENKTNPYNGMVWRFNSSGGYKFDTNPSNNATLATTANTDGSTTFTITSQSTGAAHNTPLGLFAAWQSSLTPYRFCKMRVYSMTITLNNQLVRDFVPATRDSDSKAGLYDVVNDVFYTSVNSFNFTAV